MASAWLIPTVPSAVAGLAGPCVVAAGPQFFPPASAPGGESPLKINARDSLSLLASQLLTASARINVSPTGCWELDGAAVPIQFALT